MTSQQQYKRKWYIENHERLLEKGRKRYLENRKKILVAQRKYNVINRIPRLAQGKRYRFINRERLLFRRRELYLKNRERLAVQAREYQRKNRQRIQEKYAKDPAYRLVRQIRNRIRSALKGVSKSASALELVGCSLRELRTYLELQFRQGMTWENYGPVWHLDHIRPCASFDLLQPEQQRECFHFSNLQPLFAFDNISKGARYVAPRSSKETS